MSNILSHSLNYKSRDITDYFVTLAFLDHDILAGMTKYTDVKGTKTLQKLTMPSNITRASAVGFSSAGTITLTEKDIVVKAVKAQVEQNGEAFVKSIFERALAQGYNLDDVNLMSNPDVWNKIVLPIIALAIQIDKQRQAMFSDTSHETLSGTIPNSNPTATGDVNNNIYTGLFSTIFAAVDAGTIASSQKKLFASSTPGVAKSGTYTTDIGSGSLILILNGTTYSETYDSSSDNTVDKWITSHAATVNARAGINGITVTKGSSAAVDIVGTRKGTGYTIDHTTGGGTWTATSEVSATRASGMADDKAIAVFKSLYEAVPAVMIPFRKQWEFYITRSTENNYIETLESTTGVEAAFKMLKDGSNRLSYRGIPINVQADWDENIEGINNGVYPHRVMLTPPKNLIFATDGAQDDNSIQTWYDMKDEMRYSRVKYRIAIDYLHAQLIMIAYGD